MLEKTEGKVMNRHSRDNSNMTSLSFILFTTGFSRDCIAHHFSFLCCVVLLWLCVCVCVCVFMFVWVFFFVVFFFFFFFFFFLGGVLGGLHPMSCVPNVAGVSFIIAPSVYSNICVNRSSKSKDEKK